MSPEQMCNSAAAAVVALILLSVAVFLWRDEDL